MSVNFRRDTVTLDQSAHIQKLLDDQNLSDCNGLHTPMPPGTIVYPTEDDVFTNTTAYYSIVGSLLRIANFTRPDTSYAVGQLC